MGPPADVYEKKYGRWTGPYPSYDRFLYSRTSDDKVCAALLIKAWELSIINIQDTSLAMRLWHF